MEGDEGWRARLCVTPFNEFSMDGFSGCIDSREVISALLLVRCGRSLLWCQLW